MRYDALWGVISREWGSTEIAHLLITFFINQQEESPMTDAMEGAEALEPDPVEAKFGKDPRLVAQEHFEHRLKVDGVTRDQAAAESLNMIANAAMRGDKRVISET